MLETRPYTGAGDAALPDNVKSLPDHAKAIWVAAFNSAFKSWSADKTDQAQDAYAFAVAWAAVNKLYKKNADGEWVKRSLAYEGAGRITKVWRSADGERHWRATIMDDGVDAYATRMTIEFQDDICARAAAGPMPWLGIAHYGNMSQIGVTTRLYRDGRMVKAEGTFLANPPTPLQAQLVEAAYQTALKESALLPAHRSICTSQAFYPERHAVEDCGVLAYTGGRIDHIALTTRPGNSRADFGVEEGDMSRSSKTRRQMRREDAAAIVGDDLAGQLDTLNRDAGERTLEDDGLLYRTSEDGEDLEVSPDGGETWQIAETAVARAMVPTHKPALNDPATAWDAGAARKRIWEYATDAEGNFDPKKARTGFAVYDSDNPENKTAMILPHHDIEGGKFVTQQRGVYAAGGVVEGAHGGFKEFQSGDTDHAKTHLGVHYGQMGKTPPWQRQESSLRHWAEAMEEIEVLTAAGLTTDQDVQNARAFLRFRLGDGTIKLPTVAEAIVMFADSVDVAGALLRATEEKDFAAAIRSVVSDPDNVGPAPAAGGAPPDQRVGRRVKGEMLGKVKEATGQFEAAFAAIKDFVKWAGENITAEPDGAGGRALHRTLEPDSDYLAELTDRTGVRWSDTEPDDSLIAAMNEKKMMETAYQAGYTFLDIVMANVSADPEELALEDRLRNIQNALNEFGQIISQIVAQAAQAPTRTDGDGSTGAATGAGVKPGGEGRAPVKPSTRGSASEAQAAVADVLTEIEEAAARGADAPELQVLLDRLAVELNRCVPRSGALPDGLEGALAPILERMQALQDQVAALQQSDGGQPGGGAPAEDRAGTGGGAPPQAPPRRKGFLPQLYTPLLEARDIGERPTERGWSARQIVEGAHRRTRGFDPYR